MACTLSYSDRSPRLTLKAGGKEGYKAGHEAGRGCTSAESALALCSSRGLAKIRDAGT
jgi:hypothetical protein